MNKPLMPKAVAVWLVDNTTLTFEQIAEFCGLHALEVQGIADGEVATHIVGTDPTKTGELTWEEINRCTADASQKLQLAKSDLPAPKNRKGPRYTPVSKRQDRPDAIAWLLRNHPEVTDPQISKLVGTTKATITAIRDRSYWNYPNLKPQDPVSLGLCSQIELDAVIQKAFDKQQKADAKAAREAAKAEKARLAEAGIAEPAPAAVDAAAPEPATAPEPAAAEEPTADSVFGTAHSPSSANTDDDSTSS